MNKPSDTSPRRVLQVGGSSRANTIKNLLLKTIQQPKAVGQLVRAKYTEAKAELAGQAVTRGRLLRALKDVQPGLLRPRRSSGAPEPTSVVIRDMRGRPMVYFTDGSLRHVMGYKPTRAERRAAKTARRKAS
jgi:hypothetical protein